MTSPAPDPMSAFPFIGGRPCLNFVATLGRRHGDTPFERLPDTGALARWIAEADLRAGADDAPARVTEGDLAYARTLREALYRLVRTAMDSAAPDPADVAQVNEAAARPDLAPQLGEGDDGPRSPLRWKAADPAPAALATVARDAVLLVASPLLARVKECENPGCSLLFLDDSQARRRRWCSMDRCGNLAKVAGYRSRSRAASTR
ncbi:MULTISPECIES: ABATE domain-containing protein [unclassified Streptomyces]|uniref:CGNR zinc finger domain-containing protein n=1 Tax=unclassified Streptomyces TaxID=2593676 RepID=UPI002E812213|nr:ABATE domain-containing protein [Streptomyces sp. NBC_00589]WTI34165.1 ABATE domain-containing protein [Streptomyces sp. NBC_00775]WUB32163.1 ABATE domain-containing protein [Streptomyces sp. NBC_00589]